MGAYAVMDRVEARAQVTGCTVERFRFNSTWVLVAITSLSAIGSPESDREDPIWRDITRTVEELGDDWSHCASSGERVCQSRNRNFFIQKATETSAGKIRTLKSWIGELHLTNKQAKRLGVKSYTQISPYLEKCCLIVSANVSYKNAAKDIKVLTGIEVSAKTQQRLVHRQKFPLPLPDKEIQELSVDGGKIRLRTSLGEPCIWRNYKGIRIHEQVTEAFFQENETLINWVNEQRLASPLT